MIHKVLKLLLPQRDARQNSLQSNSVELTEETLEQVVGGLTRAWGSHSFSDSEPTGERSDGSLLP